MDSPSPDWLICNDHWSDLRQFRELPSIDMQRLYAYRTARMREQMRLSDVAALVLINPVSLRYAIDYSTYALFQSRIPSTYLFMAQEGPTIIHGAYADSPLIDRSVPARGISFFDGGDLMTGNAKLLADDLVDYLVEIGSNNHRIAIECSNPSVTQACQQRGLEVLDGIELAERARLIKSSDEIECMHWAIAVAELGIAKMKETMRPGITELQLWGLLNYTNLANQGEWHEGRMLASGPRINPWLQEASQRQIESGDLVGFDTDMVGPLGYFCDISRTFHCGPRKPSKRQKQIYRLAHEEIQHNLKLVRPGIGFCEIQDAAYPIPENCQDNAYPCIIHGVGMCDEYPRINPSHRGPNPYDGVLEAGMVVTVESYMGPLGERDGVKLEEQVLVTEDGYEMMSNYPMEADLLD
ncbi:MAG: aminopeptidase P family protein [Gammaproteobacteria bacterium]|nr:aminopeptidase P family protein [Gammaproteobacteria bacterium]